MDFLTDALTVSSNQAVQIVIVILAVVVALFILRFVIDVAVTLFRAAVWIGLLIIFIYIVYTLIEWRLP